MEDFINGEYKVFCTGRLYFEALFVDSLYYLIHAGRITIAREDILTASYEVKGYREALLRKYFLNQDSVRETRIIPVTMEDKRREERKIRKQLVKQKLLFRWYEEQQKNGVQNIFLVEKVLE